MSLKSPELRVGAVVLTAIFILVAAVLLVGEQDHLFSSKNEYFIRFPNVLGLTPGNPVQLSGVNVGRVDRIVVPDEIEKQMLEVWVSIDQRYAQRVRNDSQASIKTLGLLGDKYIEITSGTAEAEELPSGAEIETAPTTEIDELLASGEDMMDNLVGISVSLKDLLQQIQSGDGYLGALIATPGPGEPTAQEMRADLAATLRSFSNTASALESGNGTLPRLINDPNLANRLDSSLERLEGILADVTEGDGMLPMMLHDAEAAQRLNNTLSSLEQTSQELANLSGDLRNGDGLLPKLLNDDEYAEQLTSELQALVQNLREVSDKLNGGDGTAALLIDDPAVYEAVNDILVGINESRMLRWLIRNRQKKGIEKRYDEAQGPAPSESEEPAAEPPAPPE